jgi:hypothetical protein
MKMHRNEALCAECRLRATLHRCLPVWRVARRPTHADRCAVCPRRSDPRGDVRPGTTPPQTGVRVAADHGHAVPGPQGQPRLRDDLLTRHERHIIRLDHLCDNELGLHHRQRRSETRPRPRCEREIGPRWPASYSV